MSPARSLQVAALACALQATVPGAIAQETFYAGKTIKIVVGFPPGGGYDIYARTVAKFLPQHISGAPAVVVANMPGAGSLVAANYIFNVAPKDGLEIGSFESFIPFEAYYNGNGVRFDPARFNWIGGVNGETNLCMVWHQSSVQSFADLLTREGVFGATGSGAPPVIEPKVANAVLGAKMKLVSGYPGTADIFVAMENREIEGTCGVAWSTLTATKADWVKTGKLRLLAQNALKRHHELPQTPTLLDFAGTDEQKKLLTLLASPNALGRPYTAPPEIPAARVETLRRAFEATMKDPAFLAETEKLKLPISPVTGREMDALFAGASKMDKALVDRMIAARGE